MKSNYKEDYLPTTDPVAAATPEPPTTAWLLGHCFISLLLSVILFTMVFASFSEKTLKHYNDANDYTTNQVFADQ